MKKAALLGALALISVPLPAAGAGTRAVPTFDHVVVVVLENKVQRDLLGNPAAPYFSALAKRSAVLTRYGGITHPSLPNYLALVSGSTHGIKSDCTACILNAGNLADTLEGADLTWKAYAEGLPRPGFTGATAGRYAKRHVPFLYFRDIVSVPARRRRVVPLRQLARDLAAGQLPSFSLVIPDACHDMHDCSVAVGDRWLHRFLPPLLRSPALANSVVFVITDEPRFAFRARTPVPAIATGPLVKPGSHFGARCSHFALLRLVEDAWGLPRLGRSGQAVGITGIWK